jgi:hypothetical protein
MTTPSELRDKLIEEYNEAIVELHQLRGAIRACDFLIESEDEEDEDDDEEDYEASHYIETQSRWCRN